MSMDTPQELVDKFFEDWMKSKEAIELDQQNSITMESEERCVELAKAFLSHLMSTMDQPWHLQDTEEVLNRAWWAADRIFNHPSVHWDYYN